MVPSPCTEGGGKTATWASGMAPNFWFRVWARPVTDSASLRRSLKSVRGKNTAAEFGLFIRPLTDRPGKATAWATPGVLRPRSVTWRTTASVRSSEAASGSWITATTYCLSCWGTKPVGVLANPRTVRASRPA